MTNPELSGTRTGPPEEVWHARAATVAEALTGIRPSSLQDPLEVLAGALRSAGADAMWLSRAVLTAKLPTVPDVVRSARTLRLDGAAALLDEIRRDAAADGDAHDLVVVVVSDQVVVDGHHTFSHPEIATGIQRVSRACIRRWKGWHTPVFVRWADGFTGLRALSDVEVDAALDVGRHLDQGDGDGDPDRCRATTVVVPWKCAYVVPELAADPIRTERLQALIRYSNSSVGLIGFDCVPLTAAETTAEGMPGAFGLYLADAADAQRIAAISDAAASEYRGWRRMLHGSGRTGPDIRSIPLAVDAQDATPEAIDRARSLVGLGPLPIVLVVGTHEPRKNHLSVLHAAEVLWRQGCDFTLVLVGARSWNSEGFTEVVTTLQARGRPVQTLTRFSDDLLWAAYRLAYCTVFTSLHEGFGLPVAESLACGTPVITSDFGSMREIAEGGGAVMVDPRDDRQLVEALRSLLSDKNLRERLARQAQARPTRSWEEYARQTWDYLVRGVPAGEDTTE